MLRAERLLIRFPERATAEEIERLRVRLLRYGSVVLGVACLLGTVLNLFADYSPGSIVVTVGIGLASFGVAGVCTPANRLPLARGSALCAVLLAWLVAVSAPSALGLIWFVAVAFYVGCLLEDGRWRLLSFVSIGGAFCASLWYWYGVYAGGGPTAPARVQLAAAYIDLWFAVVASGMVVRYYGDFTRLITRSAVVQGESLAERVAQAQVVNTQLASDRERLESLRADSRVALVTERHAAQQLRASREQLEQFAYAASHDLKEPVRTVRSFMQVVRRRLTPELADDEQLAEYFEHVERSSGTMHELLEKLLAYSRIDRRPGRPEAVDLLTAVAAATAVLGEGVKLASDLGARRLFVDRERLGMLLRELVANARTYVAEGAQPRLHVSAVAAGRGLVEVRFADEGIGIAPEYHEQVFGLFRRLHTREEYAGPGIGLALVRRIAEDAGGAAWITGSPGTGTTVHVRLPLAGGDSPSQ